MANNNGGSGFTTGFLLGGIIGFLGGLLLAPKPGEQIRAQLLERSEELRRKAEELAAQAREQVGPAIEEVKQELRRRADELAAQARERVRSTMKEVDPATDGLRQEEAEEEETLRKEEV